MLRALLVTILDCNPNRDSAAGLEELARPSYVEVRTSYLQPGLTDSAIPIFVVWHQATVRMNTSRELSCDSQSISIYMLVQS